MRAGAIGLVALLAGCASWETRPVPERTQAGLPAAIEAEGRGFLGLAIVANESESLEDLSWRPGVRVKEVVPNSPGRKAGVEPGDVVVAIDGVRVDGTSAYRAIEAAAEPGRTLRVELQRGERVLEASLVVEPRVDASPLPEVARVEEEKAGIRVRDRVVEEGGRRRTVPEIVSFADGSPFADAGLEVGDLLLQLEGRPLASSAELVARLRDEHAPGERVRIVASRRGAAVSVRVRLRAPERTLTGFRLPPLFVWERDPKADRTRWWFGDFVVFSLLRRDRRGTEVEVTLFSLFGWTRGEGLLDEGAE